jgi:DNA polymerase III epsilon subunit-like protein
MYLLFDTETTGLPKRWKAPVSDVNNWPRLVQIAWLVFENDGSCIRKQNYIVKPEGFTIPVDASRVHGITTERALEEGIALESVLSDFSNDVNRSDYLVAHNMSFDEKIVGAEYYRLNREDIIEPKQKICTMQKSTNFCAIPGPYGYKWPKLAELHQKLFGCDFEEAHNAMADITATARCFWELKRIGVL